MVKNRDIKSSIHNEVYIVSSWIAFSQSVFYIIIIKKCTIKSADFFECFKSLLFAKNKLNYNHLINFKILMDNASIHKTRQIIKFLIDFEISAITTLPYESSLNPAEQWILWIKRRFKMQANMNN